MSQARGSAAIGSPAPLPLGGSTHTFVTAWKSREDFRRCMRSQEHALSHGREPGEIMARTTGCYDAYEVLMDSREDPKWMPRR